MKPFLLAKGRVNIAEYIKDAGPEHIHRCHTDSLLSDIELNIVPCTETPELGDMKLEYHGKCEVINSNKVIEF